MSFAITAGAASQAADGNSLSPSIGAVSNVLENLKPSSSTEGFSAALRDAIGRVDGAQQSAQQTVSRALGGDGVDVHEAVIAVEKAELTFEFAVQVRNKVVQAYQEISRMQF